MSNTTLVPLTFRRRQMAHIQNFKRIIYNYLTMAGMKIHSLSNP